MGTWANDYTTMGNTEAQGYSIHGKPTTVAWCVGEQQLVHTMHTNATRGEQLRSTQCHCGKNCTPRLCARLATSTYCTAMSAGDFVGAAREKARLRANRTAALANNGVAKPEDNTPIPDALHPPICILSNTATAMPSGYLYACNIASHTDAMS